MSYHALPYTQYFLDTSCDYNHSGKPFREPQYQSLRYPCDGRLRRMLGLEHEVNYAFSYDPDRDVKVKTEPIIVKVQEEEKPKKERKNGRKRNAKA